MFTKLMQSLGWRVTDHISAPEILSENKELLAAAVDVKMVLSNPLNLRQQILRARRKDLGPQPPPATSARTYVIDDTTIYWSAAPVTPTDPCAIPPVWWCLFWVFYRQGNLILDEPYIPSCPNLIVWMRGVGHLYQYYVYIFVEIWVI